MTNILGNKYEVLMNTFEGLNRLKHFGQKIARIREKNFFCESFIKKAAKLWSPFLKLSKKKVHQNIFLGGDETIFF